MDLTDLLKLFGSTGIAGIMTGVVVWWKMTDDKARAKLEQDHKTELSAMYQRLEKVTTELISVVQENTEALTIIAERVGASDEVVDRRRQRK